MEVLVRLKSPEEREAYRRAEEAKPKCFLCGRKYGLETEQDVCDFMRQPICLDCTRSALTYMAMHFTDNTNRGYMHRKPWSHAKEDQLKCGLLDKLNTVLQREIRWSRYKFKMKES